MTYQFTNIDVLGLIRPSIDAHTLGISTIAQLIRNCGYQAIIAGFEISDAVADLHRSENVNILAQWIKAHRISRLGFSYRLDPKQAQESFGTLYYQLKEKKLLFDQGGPIISVYFAGLPEACDLIHKEYSGKIPVFQSDESIISTLQKIGVPEHKIPKSIIENTEYDVFLSEFGRKIINSEEYKFEKPIDRSGYSGFGKITDSLVQRLDYRNRNKQMPLTRAHLGPYNPNYSEAIKEFKSWVRQLSESGFLDILSIGSSQLTQSHFGLNWDGLANGGGVPINSAKCYHEISAAGKPMLFRTYAGTTNIPYMAKMHEVSMNIAWHALSFWWFCKVDGRGSLSMHENLKEHLEALEVISKTDKPFEPNIPHHFAFRGADDVTYIVSSYIAAKTAKRKGIKYLILQNMLNTPKYTWGVQDIAKSRAMLKLVKTLEDTRFRVILQTRAGLDYFSPDMYKAKSQLAAVSALMDDIDPQNILSPDIVHVVSYSEGSHLATPDIVDESIKITFKSLSEYRKLKQSGNTYDVINNIEIINREQSLIEQAWMVINSIESHIPDAYTPDGLYKMFTAGYFPVPYLWECRDEFKNAVSISTSLVDGAIVVTGDDDKVMKITDRLQIAEDNLLKLTLPNE